jgi:cobalamin biosynthesis protein CobT
MSGDIVINIPGGVFHFHCVNEENEENEENEDHNEENEENEDQNEENEDQNEENEDQNEENEDQNAVLEETLPVGTPDNPLFVDITSEGNEMNIGGIPEAVFYFLEAASHHTYDYMHMEYIFLDKSVSVVFYKPPGANNKLKCCP